MTRGQQSHINISVVPGNALEFKDDDFLCLVLGLTSQDIFDLLKIQAINSILAFLQTPDVLAVLDVDSTALSGLRNQLCFPLNNNSFVVRAGVRANIEYLGRLFQAKVGDALKRRSIKRTVPPVPLQPMMPTTGATPLFTISSAPSLVFLSVKEHNSSLNRTLKEWWVKDRREWNLQNEELTEGVDYKLVVSSSPDSASLVCGCGTVVILHLHRAHYQLSGYHKHLRTKHCNVINKKQDGSASDDEESDDDSATTGKRNGKRPAPPPALATRSKRHRTTNSVN